MALGPTATRSDDNYLTFAADLAVYRDEIIGLTRPECADEVDNDGDALVDYPADPDCTSAFASETAAPPPPVPSASPATLAALLGLLLWGVCAVTRRAA